MSRRSIGYYVHHQGAGHWQRASLIAQVIDHPVTLIGTFSDLDTTAATGSILDLPDDRVGGDFDGRDGSAERPHALHYAPVGADNVRARMGRLAKWIASEDPALIVVDVSVEIALFARLMSVPTLVVRLAGLRTDTPHLEAFRSAERLLAFFPPELDSEEVPEWVRAKTFYAGLLSGPPAVNRQIDADGSILVIYGRGGTGGLWADLTAAAIAMPERHWHVLGPVHGATGSVPANLHLHGWVADPTPYIARASLVVGGGGDGVVSAVSAAAKRFVCLPEPRAFDEQTQKSHALAAMGAALHCDAWPDAAAWPEIIAAAERLDPGVIGSLTRPGAITRTSAFISDLARQLDDRRC